MSLRPSEQRSPSYGINVSTALNSNKLLRHIMMVNVCFNNDCFISNICTKGHRGRYCSGTSFLYSDDFTEELLNLHEAKITTLKKCYEDHKDLFEGVTKWQDNWTLYLELDVSAVSISFLWKLLKCLSLSMVICGCMLPLLEKG